MNSFIYGNFQNMMFGPSGASAAGGVPQADDRMGKYMQVGSELIQRQMMMQQMAQQQPVMGQQEIVGPDGGGLNLGAPPVAAGFDMDWLSQRLAAGSANGAKIGGMGDGGGGGGKGEAEEDFGLEGDTSKLKKGGPEAGWFSKTSKNPSSMKGASGLFSR